MPVRDGPQCNGCGFPNYDGLCPMCRADELALRLEFGDDYMSIAPETAEHPMVPHTEGAEQELAFDLFHRDLRELCGRMEVAVDPPPATPAGSETMAARLAVD